jgi:hypothetical protein
MVPSQARCARGWERIRYSLVGYDAVGLFDAPPGDDSAALLRVGVARLRGRAGSIRLESTRGLAPLTGRCSVDRRLYRRSVPASQESRRINPS